MKILILGAGGTGGYFGAAIERYRAMLSAPGSALTASMLRDLENGGPIEADHIVGFMLEKARAHGVDEGMLAVAYAHLKAYEVRRGRNRRFEGPR